MTNESSSPLIQVVSSMGHTTFLCAALHICAAHESAKTGSPIDWGRVCVAVIAYVIRRWKK